MSARPTRKLTFAQEMFFHDRWVGTGKFYVSTSDPDEFQEEELEREEHWGRKQNCAKCRKEHNKMADFKNGLTQLGWFVVVLTIVVLSALMVVGWAWSV